MGAESPRQRVLITGASSGIGWAFAQELADSQHEFILTARREERLEQLAIELRAAGAQAKYIALDLSQGIERERLMNFVKAEWSCIDLLINNAGFGMNGAFEHAELERVQSMISLNVEAPIELCREAFPLLTQANQPKVINVSSIAGFVPTPYHSAYSGSKAALRIFSEALQSEWSAAEAKEIRVCCLCPGITDTEFFGAGNYSTRSMVYKMARMSPRHVARAGLKGLESGQLIVVPGLRNRFLLQCNRFLPLTWVSRMAARVMNPGD